VLSRLLRRRLAREAWSILGGLTVMGRVEDTVRVDGGGMVEIMLEDAGFF
jgi:hypothetical protein